jgi:hypothetical protein
MIEALPVRRAGTVVAAWLVATAALVGCTRASVPVGATIDAPLGPTPGGAIPTGIPYGFGEPTNIQYAVAWVAPDGEVNVRQPAGISGTVLARFPADEREVHLTGNALFLGSSLWVEVDSPAGPGWTNSWYLTEWVPQDDFCADTRIIPLLQAWIGAIEAEDGQALAGLANARRGLILRHDWWNPEVVISPPEIPGLFESRQAMDWGQRDSMGSLVSGTFREVMLPSLQSVFGTAATVTCNSLITGNTARPARWPAEYTNLNYYGFFVPDPSAPNGFNWRAWAVGVEYIQGQPQITLVVQYRGEV